ncbi:hypothetical protein BJ138DRAFT_978480, partial [Hygrophoropsis aurantiaca]
LDQRSLDISGLNLTSIEPETIRDEPPPKIAIEREKLLQEAKRVLEGNAINDKKAVSLVVIGTF